MGKSHRDNHAASGGYELRNIPFEATLAAFLAGKKSVTRRLGWSDLEPGDKLMAVEKSRGLKKGEKVKKLGLIEVISVRHERLRRILDEDYGDGECALEGFPWLSPDDFARMFVELTGSDENPMVTRIEFRRIM